MYHAREDQYREAGHYFLDRRLPASVDTTDGIGRLGKQKDMKLVKRRINGEPWRGSLVPPDAYHDVDNFFRPVKLPQYHKAPSENTPSAYPPALDATGIDLLDASMRDTIGMSYADRHFLTHDAKHLTKEQTPCWTCQKAAYRSANKVAIK